jgi:hypothetical protein
MKNVFLFALALTALCCFFGTGAVMLFGVAAAGESTGGNGAQIARNPEMATLFGAWRNGDLKDSEWQSLKDNTFATSGRGRFLQLNADGSCLHMVAFNLAKIGGCNNTTVAISDTCSWEGTSSQINVGITDGSSRSYSCGGLTSESAMKPVQFNATVESVSATELVLRNQNGEQERFMRAPRIE